MQTAHLTAVISCGIGLFFVVVEVEGYLESTKPISHVFFRHLDYGCFVKGTPHILGFEGSFATCRTEVDVVIGHDDGFGLAEDTVRGVSHCDRLQTILLKQSTQRLLHTSMGVVRLVAY